ncbi:TraR/DksA family transcriptional regulator [Streptomyces parvulus]|uniref:TraR/DksA family transcriptional regulator n=1 Tax=Streptomyces parvulus TaxID=146923 RepID=UPI0036C49652
MVNTQITGRRDRRLTPEDLAVLRDGLHEQRLFREEQLRQLTAAPPRTDAPDPCASAVLPDAPDPCASAVLPDAPDPCASAVLIDIPDPCASAARTEVRTELAASARMVLADVEAALRRLAEGRYGDCHLCRRPMDRAHLMIVPQARYCARCRQVREAGR